MDHSTKIAFVSVEMQEILSHEDWLTVEAPLASMQINSSILDGLSSEMSLLLKFSSVIGDIFDIQTLYKIMPFKDQINQEKLLAIMNQLCNKNIIEFMDGNPDNQFYRFINPFIREVIYQRMTYQQRRQIHRNVAEAL